MYLQKYKNLREGNLEWWSVISTEGKQAVLNSKHFTSDPGTTWC